MPHQQSSIFNSNHENPLRKPRITSLLVVLKWHLVLVRSAALGRLCLLTGIAATSSLTTAKRVAPSVALISTRCWQCNNIAAVTTRLIQSPLTEASSVGSVVFQSATANTRGNIELLSTTCPCIPAIVVGSASLGPRICSVTLSGRACIGVLVAASDPMQVLLMVLLPAIAIVVLLSI